MSGDERNPQEDWLRHSGLTEEQKALIRKRRNCASPLFGAIFLITAGVLLFLNSLGFLPVRNIWDYWPLVFVWMGVGRMFSARTGAERILGLLFASAGALILMVTLHIVVIRTRDGSWPFALLLIFFGLALLVKRFERKPYPRRPVGWPAPSWSGGENRLDDSTVMGAIKRKMDTQNFEGGTISCIMGGVEIDLRRAQIGTADRSATIEVRAIAGGVKLRIPETWRLQLNGSSLMGVFEDKTIPPSTGLNAPTLVITGYSAFSGVEVEN